MHCSQGTPAAVAAAAAVVEQVLTQQLSVVCVVAAKNQNRNKIAMRQCIDDSDQVVCLCPK
jgi:hypothetical protein